MGQAALQSVGCGSLEVCSSVGTGRERISIDESGGLRERTYLRTRSDIDTAIPISFRSQAPSERLSPRYELAENLDSSRLNLPTAVLVGGHAMRAMSPTEDGSVDFTRPEVTWAAAVQCHDLLGSEDPAPVPERPLLAPPLAPARMLVAAAPPVPDLTGALEVPPEQDWAAASLPPAEASLALAPMAPEPVTPEPTAPEPAAPEPAAPKPVAPKPMALEPTPGPCHLRPAAPEPMALEPAPPSIAPLPAVGRPTSPAAVGPALPEPAIAPAAAPLVLVIPTMVEPLLGEDPFA